MNRRTWLYHFIWIFALWFVDFGTKLWALENIRSLGFWGPFGLVLHQNPGAMLGAFSDLPPVLRVVSLSTGGAFLVLIYMAIQHLLPNNIKSLRYGMTILLGGILGNVTDRIIRGSVVDFLVIGSIEGSSPAFNIADVVQWVGYVMIVYALIRYGHEFWPEKDDRKKIWINPNFQLKYVMILLVIGSGFTLISGVFFFTYLKVVIDELVIGSAPAVEKKYLVPFLITFAVITVGFMLGLLIVGRMLSHRVAGPLYAFEKFLEDILSGKDRKLKLRQGDEFFHLEELADQIREHFKAERSLSDSDSSASDVPQLPLGQPKNPGQDS